MGGGGQSGGGGEGEGKGALVGELIDEYISE